MPIVFLKSKENWKSPLVAPVTVEILLVSASASLNAELKVKQLPKFGVAVWIHNLFGSFSVKK